MSLRRFILAIQSNRHLFSREAYVKRWLCSATLAPDRATQMANSQYLWKHRYADGLASPARSEREWPCRREGSGRPIRSCESEAVD